MAHRLLRIGGASAACVVVLFVGMSAACTSMDCASSASCSRANDPSGTTAHLDASADAELDLDRAPTATAPSCAALSPICGASKDEDCCASAAVPAGTFKRSYDGISGDPSFVATVSDYRLDIYEITIGRFRQFLAHYPGNLPAAGAGANPNDPADTGWDPAWNGKLTLTAAVVGAALQCDALAEWTSSPSDAESKPVGCITWYEAFAFCIWDGGRLPTEAEWNYAAAGGKEQRAYPWSSPPTSSAINGELAVYGPSPYATSAVGSKPRGVGRWGHADLAGNVSEWTRDWWQSPYRINPCIDCSEHQEVEPERVFRGGSAFDDAVPLRTGVRGHDSPLIRSSAIGARCARSG